jgi:hypothetical protein
MTEHDNLRVLGRLAAAQQQQPAKDPDHDQVKKAERHKPRSCPNIVTRPNRRSQYLRRVLKRYRRRRHQARARWFHHRARLRRREADP